MSKVRPSKEEMQAMMQAHVDAAIAAPKPSIADYPEGSFPATSLLVWLEIADRAGVQAVPARQIGVLSPDDLYPIVDGVEDHQPRPSFLELVKEIDVAEIKGKFVRADMCSTEETKHLMGSGRYPERPCWTFDDPRVFNLFGDDGRDEVPIVARPWRDDFLTTTNDDGRTYPVEYRVFFRRRRRRRRCGVGVLSASQASGRKRRCRIR